MNWSKPSGDVRLVQETRFPESPEVNLRVESAETTSFGIKFRVPLWAAKGIDVSLNGVTQLVESAPGTWATLKRTWSPGDVVTLTFDLSPRAEPLPGYVSPVAVMSGPVVLVQTTARDRDSGLPTTGPLRFPADYLEVGQAARVNPARNLSTNQEMRPFYDVGTGDFYRMYFNRDGRSPISPETMEFSGEWLENNAARQSTQTGGGFSAEFSGTAVVWEGLRQPDAGIAAIKIDGRKVGEIDQYGYTGVHVGRMDQRVVPFRWSVADLSPGKHRIEVTATCKKNAAAGGVGINVTGLIAYP